MRDMNSKEQIFDILKYNDPRPKTVRGWISDYLSATQKGYYISKWKTVPNDGTLGSIKVKTTHFFNIFVYYSFNDDCTLTCIKFKELSYAQKASQQYILQGLDTYVIYCDDMTDDEFFNEFHHVYNTSKILCKHGEIH